VWDKKNLLFFCFWGGKSDRCFGAVHFEDKNKTNALPVIKTFYVSPKNEDPVHLNHFEENFRKLAWPDLPQKPSPADYEKWYVQWASAFTHVYRQIIRDSMQLTANLAGIALGIRQNIIDTFSVETESGAIHELYYKFRKALIHDMTEAQFADMYAQTMVYGLFSARCMSDRFSPEDDPENADKTFEPLQAIDNIPSTNPFLQNLLKEYFNRKNQLSFDELDLGDITLLLQNTDTKFIIDDFNRQTGGGREDPVIYFYEGFLNAYEKEQKKRRGVYYTPQPVVKFMVQAVDDILKTKFGIKDGLASTETKTINIEKKENGRKVGNKTDVVPAIQILDPAVGTGTFLRQIILQIWDNFKNANKGLTKNSIKNKWNLYVKDNLLPRLNGFELMMAPYAVAHMKLALVLLDTEYAFDEDQKHPDRINVFLTNSLEEADKEEGQTMMFEHDALAEESSAAKKTKKNRGINVVIGNPPYNEESTNNGKWIMYLMDDYKKEPGGFEKLKERNSKSINNDYVKFIRYSQAFIDRSERGIVAFINAHGFIDNPTFRGVRWKLMQSFDELYIFDLHGNTRKGETNQHDRLDENIFDIIQGVSINIFIKNGKNIGTKEIFHADLFGSREEKHDFLFKNIFSNIKWEKVSVASPYYFYVNKNFDNYEDYYNGFLIKHLMPINRMGVCSARDDLAVDMNKNNLIKKIEYFSDKSRSDEEVTHRFFPRENKKWKISQAREAIRKNVHKDYIRNILYRPFDICYIYYEKNIVERPREEIMYHLQKKNNLSLCLIRINRDEKYKVFITNHITDKTILSSKDNTNVFPLYLYEGKKRRPNLNPKIITEIENKLNLSFVPEKGDSLTLAAEGFKEGSFSSGQLVENSFCPLDLFDYIYAVLHSPKYRETYREFLKIDFPRIPYPTDKKTFWKLVALGGELRRLHLLEGLEFEKIEASSTVSGKVSVEKVKYSEEKVYLSDDFCFEDVPLVAWEFFIGGYQPAQKWLKDRKGCILKGGDLAHYRKIVFALTETARIMGEIDGVGVV
jgi:predicted helicase